MTPKQPTAAAAEGKYPGPNGRMPRNHQTSTSAITLSTMIETAQATAAPSIPKRGMSTRLSPMLSASVTAVFSRFHHSSPHQQHPVKIARAQVHQHRHRQDASAVAPSSNPGPNTPSSAGPKIASVSRNSGHDTTISHHVAVS